jgi:pimeloyl-ACP methyl ester carboxylesterase
MAETRLRGAELEGTFRTPVAKGPFPGVLALGGSDGGTPEYFLNLLVPEGFACLGLTYWGTSDTPSALADIPLERIERGLRWLIGHVDVAPTGGRVAVVGASKGAELALLVAATFPDLVGPVVAYTPSSVVWVGLDFTLPPGTTRSSWAHRNEPVPYVRFPADVGPAWSERGMSMLPICERGLDDERAVEQAAIAVERATGPLLLVSGGDDRVWAAGRMSRMIVDRMSKHGRGGDIRHLHYPEAGHMLFPYSRPSDSVIPAAPMDVGGTAAANAAAHASAWGQVVAHLRSRSRP